MGSVLFIYLDYISKIKFVASHLNVSYDFWQLFHTVRSLLKLVDICSWTVVTAAICLDCSCTLLRWSSDLVVVEFFWGLPRWWKNCRFNQLVGRLIWLLLEVYWVISFLDCSCLSCCVFFGPSTCSLWLKYVYFGSMSELWLSTWILNKPKIALIWIYLTPTRFGHLVSSIWWQVKHKYVLIRQL